MYSSNKDILIVAPHPDDETLGMGGMITQKKKKGALVSVVFLTNGEASLKDVNKEEIISNRIKTSKEVAELYGIKNIYRLNLPDGKLENAGENAIKSLVEIIEKVSPGEIYCTHHTDKWPDHVSAASLTKKALKKTHEDIDFYYYWVWTRYYLSAKIIRAIRWKNIYLFKIEKDVKYLAIRKYKNNTTNNNQPYMGVLPKQLFDICEKSSYEVYEKQF